MASIRKTAGSARVELNKLWAALNSLVVRTQMAVDGSGGIANGTTAGRLKTASDVDFRIAGTKYTKTATDDLWNLSAQTTLGSGVYKAFWLYLSTAGAASIGAGTTGTTAAAALANLPALDGTKSVIGAYVAGPSTNFANALAAQGTIYNGVPAGAPVGVSPEVYAAPAVTTLLGP